MSRIFPDAYSAFGRLALRRQDMRIVIGILLIVAGMLMIVHDGETGGGILMIIGMALAHEVLFALIALGLFVAGVACTLVHPLLGFGLILASALFAPRPR